MSRTPESCPAPDAGMDTASLTQVVAEVYSQTSRLEPATFQLELHLQSQRLTKEEKQQLIKEGHSEIEAKYMLKGRTVTPSRISLEDWEADVTARAKNLRLPRPKW